MSDRMPEEPSAERDTSTVQNPSKGQDPTATLDAIVPESVRRVCAGLQQAGYQAYAVGGAVRDAMLGRAPGDWDVATSAEPEKVMATFKKTIPTGIKHGTVTVLIKGRNDATRGTATGAKPPLFAIEVTAFRGEGAYSDGRRPDSVHFGVPLREDLARRDFVMNAMAYDPVARVLADPFGGAADIAHSRVRAVGDARTRFAEDGLRVMRAVRFAAVLEFELDPATEAAIAPALPVLARVSRERVRDELFKLLAAEQPSRGLAIARRTGILASILPELGFPAAQQSPPSRQYNEDERWRLVARRIDAAHRVPVRLAALLLDRADELPPAAEADSPLRRLRLSNAEIERIDRLIRLGSRWRQPISDAELRKTLGGLGRRYIDDLITLWSAEKIARAAPNSASHHGDRSAGHPGQQCGAEDARIAPLIERVRTIVARGDALNASELAISGGDLLGMLRIQPGPIVGRILAALLDRVLAEPSCNTREELARLAREIHAAGPGTAHRASQPSRVPPAGRPGRDQE